MSGFSFGRTNGVNEAVAAAGTDLATATKLTDGVNVVTTSTASTADGVSLPASWAVGDMCIVANRSANSIDVWPGAAGDQINLVTAGAQITLTTGQSLICVRTTATTWLAIEGIAA